jgi:hypothetical protein
MWRNFAENTMLMLSTAVAAAIITAPIGAAKAQPTPAADAQSCTVWDHGEAARAEGWAISELGCAEIWALIRYYDERVAPRADARSDSVSIAVHPEWPVVRVIIARGDCILDIGQMEPDLLEHILSDTGSPI